MSVLQPSQTIPPEKVKKPEENKFILTDTVCVVVESSSRLTFGPKGFGKGEEEEERETNNRSAGLFLRPPPASLTRGLVILTPWVRCKPEMFAPGGSGEVRPRGLAHELAQKR